MRPIKVTQEYAQQLKENLLNKLDKYLKTVRMGPNATLDLKMSIDDVELETPIIINYTGLAWAKQCELVRTCSSEIAWHGLVRTDTNRKYFEIYDIMVYPQSVTGVTVVTDETAYEAWKAKLPDESFNALRFQAHSHVNMAPNPSTVDRTLYDKFLQNLSKDSFYMFMIVNKSHDMHMEIYDLRNNALYDNSDILLTVEGEDLDTWYATVYDDNIKKPTYPANNTVARSPAPINPPVGYGKNYYGNYFEDDYYGNMYGRTHTPPPVVKDTTHKGRGRPPVGGKK